MNRLSRLDTAEGSDLKKLYKIQLIGQEMKIIKERLRDGDGRMRHSNTHVLSFRRRKPSDGETQYVRGNGYNFPKLIKFYEVQ